MCCLYKEKLIVCVETNLVCIATQYVQSVLSLESVCLVYL